MRDQLTARQRLLLEVARADHSRRLMYRAAGMGRSMHKDSLYRRLANMQATLRLLASDVRGIVALEAAIVMPLLLSVTIGTFDIGLAMLQGLAVQNGLATAGSYINQHTDPGRVVEVVRNSTGLLHDAIVTVAPSGSTVGVTITVQAIGSGMLPLPTTVVGSGSFELRS